MTAERLRNDKRTVYRPGGWMSLLHPDDEMSDSKIGKFGDARAPWTLPEDDLARQAIAPLRGYVYQLHQSASAWIHLKHDDLLHLEVAEDFSHVLREPSRLDHILAATQIKDTRESGRVNLNSPDVLDAIRSLFRLKAANPGREVRLVFLTTSEMGAERKNPLPSGVPGLEAWGAAAAGSNVAEIRSALSNRIEPGELHDFIRGCSDEDLRKQLLAPLTFVCGAGSWQTIEFDNRNALVSLREEVQSTSAMAYQAYDALLGHLIRTILSSATRQLDRDQLIAFFERATAISVPSEIAINHLGYLTPAKKGKPIDVAELEALARTLLNTSSPSSILMLFHDAAPTVRAALGASMARERTVVERAPASGTPVRAALTDLATMPERKHLVVAAAGSGKTHTFWSCAHRLLDTGELIPLFLPIGQLNSWTDVIAVVTEAAPHHSAEAILADERVCVLLDGWAEFATGEHIGEKQKALRALHRVRVIANGKLADVGDTAFKVWSLELLSIDQASETREQAHPGSPVLPEALADLLRSPLLLSLHLLSGADASAPGELLRQFHAHLARTLPEGFTEALAGAVATLALTNDRSYGRLISELKTRARARGITEPTKLLQRLGTIVERSGHAIPVHDLYWSWLAGCGLVAERLATRATTPLHTRESYALALQSGVSPGESDIEHTVNEDLVLAAALDAGRRSLSLHSALFASLERALNDPRLAVRNRGGLAALESGRPEYLHRALSVLSEVCQVHRHTEEWKQGLRPAVLFPQRATVADWIGSPGSDLVLESIAEHGGPEWVPWLEQMYSAGKVDPLDALATALACDPKIPVWGLQHLDELLSLMPWKLFSAAERRANRVLARYVAANYGRLVESIPEDGAIRGFHLNEFLVACGDDEAFQLLLNQFASASTRVQEVVAYAVVDRGPPWIEAFQRIVFATPGARDLQKLSDTVSLEIDDATARAWIKAGYEEIGWRVLIARHDAEVVSELVAQFPPSFAGLHHIRVLSHLRFVKQAPSSLIPELLRRFGSPMRPKVLEEVFDALATVYPEGMAYIVQLIGQQPNDIPLYHIAQALRLYARWRERAGTSLMVRDSTDTLVPFDRWIVLHCTLSRWDDHFAPQMLSSLPDLAIELVLGHFRTDDAKSAAVLASLKSVESYRADLLERMLSSRKLASLVPNVFADCFDTFPADALHQCIASPQIDQTILLLRLAAGSNPLHLSVHKELIQRILKQPVNLHHYGFIANMLRSHTRFTLIDLLKKTISLAENDAIWFVREVETTRGERLIDEAAHFLA
jgi:hypothetical protein